MKTTLFAVLLFFCSAAFSSQADFADLYERHSASVVTVYTASVQVNGGQSRTSQGVGSGVLIEDDQILTAAHVVDNAHIILSLIHI